MTTVVISQPMYFPWPGFLDLMQQADILIWLDDVMFSKGSFTNRVQVLGPTGTNWMTVPLCGKGTFTNISELRAKGEDWRIDHHRKLSVALSGYPHYKSALDVFDPLLRTKSEQLSDFLIASCEQLALALKISPDRIQRSSQLGVQGKSWKRVLDLVKEVGGSCYISAAGGANYIDHAAFEAENIEVRYMMYDFRPWRQNYTEFTPYLTGLDLLAARGAEGRSALKSTSLFWADFIQGKHNE